MSISIYSTTPCHFDLSTTPLRRMGPAHFAHINFRGTFRFGIEKYAQSLIKQSSAIYNARTVAAA
jgi:hypothetical protein